MDEATITEASLPGRSDGSSLHYTGWAKRSPYIYLKGNRVIHSVSWEFPPGSEMTDYQIKTAKAHGYLVMMVTESTITPDVETQPASAGRAEKRIPKDLDILLNEIDLDRLTEDQLIRYIHLSEFALKYLDQEFSEDLQDVEFISLINWLEAYDPDNLLETKMAKRSSLSKKLASARRYRNRRQHVLRKKKEAESKKSQQIIKKKMSYSLKTKTGREKKEYHVNESTKKTTFADFMKAERSLWKDAEHYKFLKEWLKRPEQKITVEHYNPDTRQIELIDADLYQVRAGKIIREALGII